MHEAIGLAPDRRVENVGAAIIGRAAQHIDRTVEDQSMRLEIGDDLHVTDRRQRLRRPGKCPRAALQSTSDFAIHDDAASSAVAEAAIADARLALLASTVTRQACGCAVFADFA